MKGPPLGPVGEDITWRDQVTPRVERRLVPAKSNLKPKIFVPIASCWIQSSFPARTFANIVDATFALLQPSVVVEVLVLFEHFLSNLLQLAAHLRRSSSAPRWLADKSSGRRPRTTRGA